MATCILGVDVGTTGVKAKLYDLTGNVTSQGSCEYSCIYPHPGWVDQDVNMLSSATFRAIAMTVAASGIAPSDIASVGLSTQRGLHLYVDDKGQVLRNGLGISWQDSRHHEQLNWLRSVVGEQRFYDITGLPISAFWPVGKILWMQINEPEEYLKARKILSIQEYLLRQLGARDGWYMDWSNAALTGLMDIGSFEWSRELLGVTGIDRDLMPEIVPAGHKVGVVDRGCHELTGLAIGTPICTGGGDQQCAGIGAGVIRQGLCELTFGTAGNSVAYVDRPIRDPKRIITCSAHALPTKGWELEGIQAAAGASYRWFRDHATYLSRYSQPNEQMVPYETINNLAKSAPVGSDGLLFLPYLAGAMTPHYDSYATGAYIGLTLKHDTAAMARAILEGVAFEAKEIFDAYATMDLEFDEVRLAGGTTKSTLWSQIQADIYGRPTVTLREGECAVLGAAILGAVGAGVFGNVEEGCTQTVHRVRVYEPNPSASARYEELYQIFRRSYEGLSKSSVFQDLETFRNRPNRST